jgi:hypothetical protein
MVTMVATEGHAMDLYQEVAPCLNCGTRLTVCGPMASHGERATGYEVGCPVCSTGVAFRGVLDPGTASLICYERPLEAVRSGRR